MASNFKQKSKQLGMSFSTAQIKLIKMKLLETLIKHEENICYRCDKSINFIRDLSIDHKKDWYKNKTEMFWDLDNVAFSHRLCNSRAGGLKNQHYKK